jgi:Fe-S cluster assembly protein SufD
MTLLQTAPAEHGVTAAFNREAVEARSAHEPAWLQARRIEAWDIYADTPVPNTRSEEWRYTDPRLLAWDKVAFPGPIAPGIPADAQAILADKIASGTVVQYGTSTLEATLDDALRARGVILTDLATAAIEHQALVKQFLGTRALLASAGKFAALNSALWSGGVFLYVPRGVRLERPVRVVRYVDRPGAYMPRTLVVTGEGSHAVIIEQFASPDFEQPVFCNGAVEIHAGPASETQYVALQQWGKGVRHLSTQRTVAQRDASLNTLAVNLGATVARVDLGASLEGPGARSELLGLYFGRADQHFDHETRQDHKVPHANSNLLYKGALTDRSTAVFRGLIKVWKKAQRTDAYQTNRNLLLSKYAQATSLPNLEIEADDVRCSHAATVGHLDAEELFYIMSRGIRRSEAERLVVFGFFGDVLDRLPLPDVVRELRAAIEKRIG